MTPAHVEAHLPAFLQLQGGNSECGRDQLCGPLRCKVLAGGFGMSWQQPAQLVVETSAAALVASPASLQQQHCSQQH
jgi:hypothetical protein